MEYKYETHLHTNQGSACGKVPGRDYIAKYKDLGYAGIFVTDHFFHGNCKPDRNLPWAQWVDEYCRGYEDALEEGEKQGLQVFFGLEERFDHWDEWLVYGLTKDYMLAHPDMRDWTRKQWVDNVHAAGGCVVQCHPFRQAAYMQNIAPCLDVDGVEICNSGNKPEWDALAARYIARMLPDIFTTAGSDIHNTADRQGEGVFGVSFDHPLTSVYDYANAVRQKAPHGLIIPAGRDTPSTGVPQLAYPLTVFGWDCQPTRLTWADIL